MERKQFTVYNYQLSYQSLQQYLGNEHYQPSPTFLQHFIAVHKLIVFFTSTGFTEARLFVLFPVFIGLRAVKILRPPKSSAFDLPNQLGTFSFYVIQFIDRIYTIYCVYLPSKIFLFVNCFISTFLILAMSAHYHLHLPTFLQHIAPTNKLIIFSIATGFIDARICFIFFQLSFIRQQQYQYKATQHLLLIIDHFVRFLIFM